MGWEMLRKEMDLLVVTKQNCAYEVEIKVTKADLLKDKEKRHNHGASFIRAIYFAIPKELEPCIPNIPEKAGVFVVSDGKSKLVRKPKINRTSRKLTDVEVLKVARLGTMRIWNLKRKLLEK
jgi:hypothetical protein